MITNDKKLNRDLIIGWSVIVIVLFVAYFIEVIKQERSWLYVLVFMLVTGLPPLVCCRLYRKNPLNRRLRYYIVAGYFMMYLFVMFSGNTTLVFTYILPLLSLLILYHQPKLILTTGIVTLMINAVSITMRFLNHQITMDNSKDVEIQIALLLLCFGEAFLASVLYDDINRKKEEYFALLEEKSKQIQKMTLQTIETIANTIDAKDEYTRGHSRRVSEYSAKIAEKLNMSQEEIMNIRYVALLHDIGKIGVPDAVLNKPGRLTDAEYELMKKHTIIGGEILKDIGMLPDLDVGAKYHHERYDGKGYPKGLKGEEIPKTARIICIADAYDAMTSTRVYRKQLSREYVIEELKRCRGTQFDPDITDVFLQYLEEEEQWETKEETVVNDSLAEVSGKLLQKIVVDQNRHAVKEAEKDVLTDVYNRSTGERKAEAAMLESKGALLLVNVDNMRRINSKYGFRRGDYYLINVAGLLKELATDVIVSRFSGDEFLCYLPHVTDTEQLQDIMNDFMKEVHNAQEQDELLENFSVSAGITIHMQEGEEFSKLLMEADKALYHVKQETKDSYYFYRQVEGRSDDVAKVDLNNLVEFLRSHGENGNLALMDEKDFTRIYDFIYEMKKEKKQNVQLVMFTAKTEDVNGMSIEEREEVMRIIECAIFNTLQDDKAISRYSSVQRMVMMVGEEQNQMKQLTDRILKDFYKMYDKKNVELYCDIASIGENGYRLEIEKEK